MKIAVMQPYFFPYLGYWQLVQSVDLFVVFDDVNFIKKGWINRNNILLNGKPYLFTVPLKNISQRKLINEIEVVENKYIREGLLKTIVHAYRKALYFVEVFPIIEQVMNENGVISEVLEKSLTLVCEYCSIDTKIIFSSKVEKDNSLKGQDKIIEICKKVGGTDYINAVGGKNLYSRDVFKANGINLHFIEMDNKLCYRQYKDEFIPNLSIIDVLMFNNKEQLKKLLHLYKLS